MKKNKIAIIVPCRNEVENIESTIRSILSQQGVQDLIEVIIADGLSDDGTRIIIDKLSLEDSRIKIIENHKKIVSSGLNSAIKSTSAEIIIRMDVHTEYADDYVLSCVNALYDTGAQNVGGPAQTRATTYFQKANSLAYHSSFGVGGALFHNIYYEGWVDTVTYGCWKRSTLLDLGLFDEELVRNQDDEMNLRIVRAGGRIWQTPSIRSWYLPRDSIFKLFKQYMQYGFWKVRVIQKHRLPASIRHIIPGLFVSSLILMAFLSFVDVFFVFVLIGTISFYLLLNLIASVIACHARSNFKYLPIMPLVFAAYHFSYGIGFMRGLFNFWLLNRIHADTNTELTR